MEVLKKNYFDPKHPIAFAGVEKYIDGLRRTVTNFQEQKLKTGY